MANPTVIEIEPVEDTVKRQQQTAKDEIRKGALVISIALIAGILLGRVSRLGNNKCDGETPDGTATDYASAGLMLAHTNLSQNPCTQFSAHTGSYAWVQPEPDTLDGPAAAFLNQYRTMPRGHIALPVETPVHDALRRGIAVNGVTLERTAHQNVAHRPLMLKIANSGQSPTHVHTIPLRCRGCTSAGEDDLPDTRAMNRTCEHYVAMLARSTLGCGCCNSALPACSDVETVIVVDPADTCDRFPLTVAQSTQSAVEHALQISSTVASYTMLDVYGLAAQTWPDNAILPHTSPAAIERATALGSAILKAAGLPSTPLHVGCTWTSTLDAAPDAFAGNSFDDVIYAIDRLHSENNINSPHLTHWIHNPYNPTAEYDISTSTLRLAPALVATLNTPSAYSDGVVAARIAHTVATYVMQTSPPHISCTPSLPQATNAAEYALFLVANAGVTLPPFELHAADYDATPAMQYFTGAGAGLPSTASTIYDSHIASAFECSLDRTCSFTRTVHARP